MQSATAEPLESAVYDGGFAETDGGDSPINWGRYISAIKRYKWLILLVTVLGTAIGVIATRFMKPIYTVKATVWINLPDKDNGPLRPTAS